MFPASLRAISHAAFAWCESLRTVKFREGLKVLGTADYPDDCGMLCGVFEYSPIESIELPSTLKRIEYKVFENCKNLQSITLPDSL